MGTYMELDYQIGHDIYVDDIHLIIEDRQLDIDFSLDIFGRFGKASGLICDWQKTCSLPIRE